MDYIRRFFPPRLCVICHPDGRHAIVRSVTSARSANRCFVRQYSFRLLVAVFLSALLLISLPSLQQLKMPRLLCQKLLSYADQSGCAFVLDLVLRDNLRILRLDHSCAGLRASALTIMLSVLVQIAVCGAAQEACATCLVRRNPRLVHHRLGFRLDRALSHFGYLFPVASIWHRKALRDVVATGKLRGTVFGRAMLLQYFAMRAWRGVPR
jgi:hypothetical protein